jgi:predicted nuclease of predicted toxin-antitoxin system
VKIKLDENMPARLAERLFAAGHDTDTVQHEGLKVTSATLSVNVAIVLRALT